MGKTYQPIKRASGGYFTKDEFEVYSAPDIVFGDLGAAEVLHVETDQVFALDPDAVCPAMQWPIFRYAADPPKSDDGYNDWLLVSGSRQTLKSYTSGMAGLNRVAFTRSGMGATIADNSDRAKDLFEKTLFSMKSVPAHMRPTILNEDNAFTRMRFDQGDKAIATYKILTAGSANVGIGKSLVHCHASEIPFWDDFLGVWDGLFPALNNRKNATVILESTPAPLSEPSAPAFRAMLLDARSKYNADGTRNRFNVLFVPYFLSKANERQWTAQMHLSNKEQSMLDAHGCYADKNRAVLQDWLLQTKGRYDPEKAPGAPWLTYLNLAFRRDVMANNPKVKRNPDLFDVWFPSDPLTCWAVAGGSTFPKHIVEKHRGRGKVVAPWFPDDLGVQVYEDPEPGAVYVIGVDPSGYTIGDPAAFSIWKAWDQGNDGFEQVLEFASQEATPMDVAYLLAYYAKQYNDAYIIAEKTGVGLATVTQLVHAFQSRSGGVFVEPVSKMEVRLPIRNLHYHKLATGDSTPGMPATKQTNMAVNDAALDMLLKDTTIVRSEALIDQMGSYREDRQVRETETHKILNPGTTLKGRKPKHHWDRVSAMMLACYGAQFLRRRFRPSSDDTPRTSGEYSHEDMNTYEGREAWRENERRRLDKDRRARKERSRRRGRRR